MEPPVQGQHERETGGRGLHARDDPAHAQRKERNDSASVGRDCLAVAYNVLIDVEDAPAAVKEIRRVLRPSGTLVISIVHPFADRGRFAGPEANAPFVLQKSYFGRERFEDTEVRIGLEMHFAGWSQPLESYMSALEDAGLAMTSLREPVPDPTAHAEEIEVFVTYLTLVVISLS